MVFPSHSWTVVLFLSLSVGEAILMETLDTYFCAAIEIKNL